MLDRLTRLLTWVLRPELKKTFSAQQFIRTNERAVEYSFAFKALNEAQPQRVIDVGTGRSAFPALLRTCGFVVTASDNVHDYWTRRMFNRHWYVVDDDIRASRLPAEQFDAVTCISVLEHVAQPLAAVAGMHRLLRNGGRLILTTPFGGVGHENVYTLPGSYGVRNSYPCRQSTPADLEEWRKVGFRLVTAEYWEFFRDSLYWSCGPLMRPPRHTAGPGHLGCFVFEKEGSPG